MSLKDHPLVADWLTVSGDTLCVHTGKVDIGQRISTALRQIARDELTLADDEIEVLPVRTDISPNEGVTAGSNSIEHSGRAVRHAAATLRRDVVRRAAERFGGAPQEWTLSEGRLLHPALNRPIPFAELAGEADPLLPVDLAAPIAPPSAVPPSAPMRGIADLVTGRYPFIHDLDVPGMHHARMVRPPHRTAVLVEVPARITAALEADGMRIVRDGSVLAIAGPAEWPVVKAAARLAAACRWDAGAGLSEADVFAALAPQNAIRLCVDGGTPVAREPGAPIAAPSHAARYERPFTMHGALAPSAAFAHYDGDALHIISHSQGIYPLRESLAESVGLSLDRVTITFAPGSGCYGHNGADDAALDAALVAMALPGTPVLLKWSRDDEHAYEPYSTAQAVELAARVDADGIITQWSAEAFAGTYGGRPRPGPGAAGPSRLLANTMRAEPFPPHVPQPDMSHEGGIHRNLTPAYRFADLSCVKNLVTDLPLRTSALRCLGAAANVFAIESFMDEVAALSGADPIALRCAHLDDPRAVAVLTRLDEAVRTWPERGEGEGRGIAYAQYKNAQTRTGIGVSLRVTDAAEILLQRVVIVADAGRVVDRDGLIAQLEGGFLQAASWALHEEVTWDRDGVTSRDWDTYPVLRFDNVPDIAVILMPMQDHDAVGAGEASSGPAVAAIANAVADATGLRMRRLPFTPSAIMARAAEA